jgi:hypothetical protein
MPTHIDNFHVNTSKAQDHRASRQAPSHDKFKKIMREPPASRHKKDENKKKSSSSKEEALSPFSPGQLGNAALAASTLATACCGEITAAGATASSQQLSAEIQALFEKMAGTMILLSSSLETETSVFLDAPQFASSPFYGSRITIKEFSTAPKAFNIEIATNPAALSLLQTHQAALMTSFQQGNFNFSIGRIDTEIQNNDRPLFHRKESISQDDDARDQESNS